MTHRTAILLALGLLGVAACPDIRLDRDEGDGPIVELDPAAAILPFPNDLLRDPATGRVSLPAACGERPAQAALRTAVLNTLDGFASDQAALQVTFSEPVDPTTLAGHVVVYQRARGGVANDPATARPIAVTLLPGTAARASADCATTAPVSALTIVPAGVLDERATYTVALTRGIRTAAGAELGASATWSLIRGVAPPVAFDDAGQVVDNRTPLDPRDDAQRARLVGLGRLWQAHRRATEFLDAAGHPRGDLLIAWELTTQSTDALDPLVPGSLAASLAAAPLSDVQPIPACGALEEARCVPRAAYGCAAGESNGQCLLAFVLGQGNHAAGVAACTRLGCAQISEVLTARLAAPAFQADTANPIGGAPVPGAWRDPVHPAAVRAAAIDVLVFAPSTTAPPAAGTVVFGHGLGSSKLAAAVIAAQLAGKGFATVAIDFVAHASRAVRTSADAARGCADVVGRAPDPTRAAQCFAPFLSSDLAGTRDNVRQTVLDLQGLIAALGACGAARCGALKVDPAHVSYLGVSLGGVVGATLVATAPGLQSAVLDAPGVGLVDLVEHTANLAIRCGVVDALIAAGVVAGAPFDPASRTGLCTTDAWRAQPGYREFAAIARWVLAPADGASFAARLAGKRLLIQEIVDDQVVPNLTTERLAALAGLAPSRAADPATALTGTAPSAAIAAGPSAFVRYVNLAPGTPSCPPGNTFQHASLLAPAATVVPPALPGDPPPACNPATGAACDGLLGTARLQADAIGFLALHP